MGLRPTVYCKRPGHADCEYRIQTDIPTNNVINVEVWCTGFRYDFDNILESIHTSSLKNIEEKGVNNFSEKLLEALNNMTFN